MLAWRVSRARPAAVAGARSIFARSAQAVQTATLPGPWELELGGTLPELHMAYEEWNPHGKEVVLLLPSFSMGSHARSTVEDPTAGWYEGFLGPRKGIDTDIYRVICPANLGAPFGSTSPISANPRTGERWGATFPQITPADIARAAHRLLTEHLGVEKLHCVIGGSLGGNVTLSFVSLFPHMARRAVAMCCTGRTSPLSVGLRHVQRTAIASDPNYHAGDYWRHGVYPTHGMSVARQLAMLVYKSWDAFNSRFDWQARPPYGFGDRTTFAIESYLTHQGSKFASGGYDPNCYLLLSKCADLTNLQWSGGVEAARGTAARPGESFLDAVLRIECELLIMGVTR